ncbi:LANO_0C02806g1_1 [Lachancea nothofagi CBS 11611]|uniref:LANO_0C02806g1_1 n=1 Tax=Lachancea nothofagi CBS 11611 TaxID=1266666 RepID=A0A1G4J532_9SACH|nr:LANO_0C02806g1_1 [Lachancea nothofagi CBS 11611]
MFTQLRPQVFLGSLAPNFKVSTSQGPLEFYNYTKDSWCLFFSHPADFTPICTTEIGALAQLSGEFEQRNCKLLGLSTNSRETHVRWIQDIESVTGTKVKFPIVCDEDRRVSTVYGMIDPRNLDSQGRPVPLRFVVIIDPRHEIRLLQAYPLSTGRNTAELLRCLDSLQVVDEMKGKVMTPINWIPGDDVILAPEVSPREAERDFPNSREIRPYLRFTPLDVD